MARVHTILLILISPLMLIADARIPSEKRENIARFRVYAHDVLGGPNATSIEVARANITSTSPTSFGQVLASDTLMTAGPDLSSQKLGRAQGLAISTGREIQGFNINGVFIFTGGKYNGSTLSILGWKLVPNPNQELPIVGGTGIFRLVRGYTVSNAYSYDPATNYYVWIYDMYVVYEK